MKTIDEQIKSAERELVMRQQLYPRWLKQGKMEPDIAQHELECMAEIVETLKGFKTILEERR